MASGKNNPYGFNENYETVTKIIGSKYIRCHVEKNIGKAKEGVKAETQSMLQTLPPCNTRQTRGNAPGLNKPPCQQINYALNDEQQNKGEKEEHKSQQPGMNDSKSVGSKDSKPVNKHCVTAPSGDKSLSYIHTLKKTTVGPQSSGHLERQEVNYEKLLQFLRGVAASTAQQTQSLPEKTEYVKNQRKSSWTPEDALQTLKQMLKDHKGGMNLGKLRLDFMQQDKSFSGLLSLSEIDMICHMNGLPLYPGMLGVLAVTYDLSRRDRILWNSFVEFLKKVQSGIDSASLFSKRSNKEKGEDNNQKGNKHHKDLSTEPWEEMNPNTSDSSDFEKRDAWIDRFGKLEKALYLSDVKNTGKLEKEKAKRLIHNYNQIYDLCLSPLKIDKAFRPFRPGQDMALEPLLQYLKEL
ncbi:uncharacterized protein C1orf87 homolog isoform X3 [Anolis carolinensis]|uniref:uncharacterized protein C1orf87 homolog isoform X3 n=1 Tax=Anolis carolinensis TaxID=28377 RepID=UPI002F2B1785